MAEHQSPKLIAEVRFLLFLFLGYSSDGSSTRLLIVVSWVQSPLSQLETLDLLFQSTPQKGYERAFTTGGRGSPTCTLPRENYSAVCPVGRGCGLENRLDVKVSGVQIPNTAWQSKGYVRFVGVWVARSLSKNQ